MKNAFLSFKLSLLGLSLLTALSLMTTVQATESTLNENLNENEALKLATEAYIFGYPLITVEMTRRVMTNVEKPESFRGPMGQFVNIREYPSAKFKDVTAPNADTLYSVAWLNLSKEPYIIHLPDEHERYYLMPMLSGWTDVFDVPGKRTTGTKEQNYVITGPDWHGSLPKGMKELKSSTNLVWIIGRTYCTGTAEDYKLVHAIQDQYKVVPLSAFGKEYTPPKGVVDPSIDMKTPVRDQVNAMDAASYFKMLAELMKENPPTKADNVMIAKLAKLGIEPGKPFDISNASSIVSVALNKSVKLAQEQIMAHEKQSGELKNGWTFSLQTGQYGIDYLQRAFIAAVGLGANRPQDAIYPMAKVDSNGKTLNGKNRYILHFPKGQLPPVNGFWSLTMYDDKFFFVENPLNKYTVSERNRLAANKDGSVDILIQHESPGKEKEANWLPAPADDFILMLRFYWPKEPLLDGRWDPPAIEMLQ